MTVVAGRGIGVSSLLGITFVACKLTGNIDWSWWWVTAPFWIPYAVVAVFLFLATVLAVVASFLDR